MILFWECLIAVLLFTLIVVPMTLRNPLASLGDYPPAIRHQAKIATSNPTTRQAGSPSSVPIRLCRMWKA